MELGVFVSYRRSDAGSAAGRLCDHIRSHGLGDGGELFFDIDTIAPGADFRAVIRATLEQCAVVLVVIGPGWLTVTDSRGRRRLESPSDTHRLEVEAALRSTAVVIPVLVEGAQHPRAEELPEGLSDLAFRNSWELSERRFAGDAAGLVDHLLALRKAARASREAALAEGWRRQQEQRRHDEIELAEREATTMRAQAVRDREDRESEARLRKEHSQANLYESLERSTVSRRPRPLRWTSYFLLYWIPSFFVVIWLVNAVILLGGKPPKDLSWSRLGEDVLGSVILLSPVVGAGLYLRKRARRHIIIANSTRARNVVR